MVARIPRENSHNVVHWLPVLAWICCGLLHVTRLNAGDWPQVLGPQRSGVATDEVLPDTLPAPPNQLWSHPIGQGYAGPAVAGERVYIFHRIDGNERLESLDRRTGRPQWQADFSANYQGGIDPDLGPRCVPLVVPEANLVLAYGAAGSLHAVNLRDGRKMWTRELFAEYGAPEGYFGAGSTPIVVDDRVLINVGGRGGAGLVALDLKSGRPRWKTTDEDASYSSPIVLPATTQSRVCFVTRYNALIVDPADGKILARRPFGQRGPTVNAASPVRCGDNVFVTASYGVGGAMLRTDDRDLTPRWQNDSSLSSQYNTPIYHVGHLYGIHGREDVGRAELRCVDAETGRVAWNVPDFGVAHLLLAGDRLLILNTVGELRLVDATPAGYRERSMVSLTKAKTRALPALSSGCLFLRDNDADGGRVLCLAL
ncbi:MAG: PQQ-like beta-propeller repeat protein [Planctomycetales bacterium]|nr:PQQ-like beta-propeller repeat protein [Planctomycetales bacterium]MCA9166271.1 PQQ-like beta-propeller repeat protein [Planctomycetales bacterium]